MLFVDEQPVDDRNMPGKTLGVRRLQSDREDLLPLNRAVLDLPELIHSKTKFFIDKYGTPFVYRKSISSTLKCYKIKKIQKKDVASLLWLHNWPSPFTLPRPPITEHEWVRMLHLNGAPWIIYDYVERPTRDTRRKI